MDNLNATFVATWK